MYECGKLKKVIGNKFLFPVILEQCELYRNDLPFFDINELAVECLKFPS